MVEKSYCYFFQSKRKLYFSKSKDSRTLDFFARFFDLKNLESCQKYFFLDFKDQKCQNTWDWKRVPRARGWRSRPGRPIIIIVKKISYFWRKILGNDFLTLTSRVTKSPLTNKSEKESCITGPTVWPTPRKPRLPRLNKALPYSTVKLGLRAEC